MDKIRTVHTRLSLFVIAFAFLLAACRQPMPTETPLPIPPTAEPTSTSVPKPTETYKPGEEPIYLTIIWHQHQPLYFKDPQTGVYIRPWVRLHATKDYVDMAAILREYPEIHVTFNLTPSLIKQLDDMAGGTKDLYQVHAEIPANQLTETQKQFILDRFFDINRRIIARFPRFEELLRKRDASQFPLEEFTTQDFLDLQVLFNLAWVDPDWLAQEPLATLVKKGRDFAEEDKRIVFSEHLRLIREVIPIHRQLQEEGQIEITMTPYAHPILPLLVTTDLARKALPDVELPSTRFVYGQDAVAQIELGVQFYQDHFGVRPKGMWPAEGAVAQEIVTMVAKNGIQWMASDEGVLAKSLGFDSFTRDQNELVVEADKLYHPYYVQGKEGDPVAIIFRDVFISDKVGFTYSGMEGKAAASDFINRIHAIRKALKTKGVEGPHLVSVILDGENAWEHYDNDGKVFLHSLYRLLSDDPLIVTVTPSEFLEIAPEQPTIEELWAGSWINHDFATWIGEEEENTAWEYLAAARTHLQKYITGSLKNKVDAQTLDQAKLWMYAAEGSDWFWWYGTDQNSGNDEIFDQQFRDTLKQIYFTLGDEPPRFLDVPIIPQLAVTADRPSSALISPIIDGTIQEDEWAAAGLYSVPGMLKPTARSVFENMVFGFDSKNLYLGFTLADEYSLDSQRSNVEIYINIPGGGVTNNFSRGGNLLGFPAEKLVTLTLERGKVVEAKLYAARGDETWEYEQEIYVFGLGVNHLELSLPLELLGNADSGDRITMRAFFSDLEDTNGEFAYDDIVQIPGRGPAELVVPDLGTTTLVLSISDPEGDDYGPGSYTYPLDAVFTPGNFDVLNFSVGYDQDEIIFKFTLRGPVDNPWGSPNGLSLQTLDIYIDKDGDGRGGKVMLPGRNLSLAEGYAWDYAITAEGWTPGIFVPGENGPQQVATANEFLILADPGKREVTIRVPKAILGDNPGSWKFGAVVLSQEGFPSAGVMRVRDVLPVAEQWRVGGAPPGVTNHTRVIDLVWPIPGDQEAWLSDFIPTNVPQSELTFEDFAKVPLLSP